MFTYGYIREATMARLDIDESEAQAMNLLTRFHIFANEAMQAICASKPMYQYIDVTVVEKFDPIVTDGSIFRKATEAEINWNVETQGELDVRFLTEEELKKYYHEQGIYQVLDIMSMSDTFIAFADNKVWREYTVKASPAQIFEHEAFGTPIIPKFVKEQAVTDVDFSYISKNKIKFYKPGRYLIPAKYMWFRFDSGLSDNDEIDMPADILLCIPIYIAAICLQIDNMQKSQIMRNEFEVALSRCTSTEFLTLNDVKASF